MYIFNCVGNTENNKLFGQLCVTEKVIYPKNDLS